MVYWPNWIHCWKLFLEEYSGTRAHSKNVILNTRTRSLPLKKTCKRNTTVTDGLRLPIIVMLMENFFLLNVLITENFYQFSYCSWNTLSLIEVLVEYLCPFFHYLRNTFISYFTVRWGLYSLYYLYHPLYHSLTTYGTLRNTLVRYCATNGVLLTVIFLIAENFCQSLYNLQPGNLYQLFYFLVMSCQCNLFKTKINWSNKTSL